jgi:hypothetical protein
MLVLLVLAVPWSSVLAPQALEAVVPSLSAQGLQLVAMEVLFP